MECCKISSWLLARWLISRLPIERFKESGIVFSSKVSTADWSIGGLPPEICTLRIDNLKQALASSGDGMLQQIAYMNAMNCLQHLLSGSLLFIRNRPQKMPTK